MNRIHKTPPTLTFRTPHGIADRSCVARSWIDVAVYSITTWSKPGKSWLSMVNQKACIAVILEQQDGIAEPRKRLHVPTPRIRYDAGHTMYIPPNCDIWGFGDSTSMVRNLNLYFDRAVVEGLLQEDFTEVKWREPVLLLYDDRIRDIAALIWQECHMPGERPQLYGESLTAALLSCIFEPTQTMRKTSQIGLSRIQLRRTTEYMQASLLRDVRLGELASVAGLSPSHFGRAFKASTGTTPYRWIVRRRIELAQRLMRESGKSIVIASQMAGFASQSHFTKAFRGIIGTTPRAWIRDVGAIEPSEIERSE